MDEVEREALQELHLRFMDDLDPWEIMIDFLHEKRCFNHVHLSNLESMTDKRKCRRYFLELVKQKCTYRTFMDGLVFRDTHVHLAKLLEEKVVELGHRKAVSNHDRSEETIHYHYQGYDSAGGRKRRQPGSNLTNTIGGKRKRDEFTEYYPEYEEKEEEETPETVNKMETNEQNRDDFVKTQCCPLCKRPNRIDTMDTKKKRVVRIQHHLKVLSHDGQTRKFESFMKEMFKRHKKDPDIKFALLDARVGRKKVSDTIIPDEDVFRRMEKVIPYTTNPLATSMLYLSRKGSAIATRRPIEEGLAELNFAKSHSEFIQPCKDTGMVIYIEVNLLMKLFEKSPSRELKEKIIKRLDEAINVHFAEELPEVKEDYTRMLYLKMVFCYLGIGVDAGQITGYTPSGEDIKNAESCLAVIDRLPAMLDKRRMMFYHVARSVLFRYTGVLDLAWDHVRSAVEKAKEGEFGKELSCINCLADCVKVEIEQGKEELEQKGLDLIKELDENVDGCDDVSEDMSDDEI